MVVQVHLFKKMLKIHQVPVASERNEKDQIFSNKIPIPMWKKRIKREKKSNPDSDSDAEKKNKKRKKSSPATKEIVDYSKSLLTPESVKPTTAYVSPALLQAVKAVRSTKAANPQEPTE